MLDYATYALSLRPATPEDAGALGRLHAECWRETYQNLLPSPMVDRRSPADRAAYWAQALRAPPASAGGQAHLAFIGDRLVGFGACGAQRTPALCAQGYDGEVSSLYILRSAQGCGVGWSLMRRMAADLAGRGLRGVSLWVVRDNLAARGFYERLGGRRIRGGPRRPGSVAEIAYGWPKLSDVAAPRPA